VAGGSSQQEANSGRRQPIHKGKKRIGGERIGIGTKEKKKRRKEIKRTEKKIDKVSMVI